MGLIRADSVRVTDWGARTVGSAWRAFDLQLVTYAGLLVTDHPARADPLAAHLELRLHHQRQITIRRGATGQCRQDEPQ